MWNSDLLTSNEIGESNNLTPWPFVGEEKVADGGVSGVVDRELEGDLGVSSVANLILNFTEKNTFINIIDVYF